MRKLSIVMVILALVLMAVPVFAQDEEPTIAEIVVSSTEAETPEFTVLLAAVSAADPVFLEVLSSPDANVTVFAPTDAAFTALLEALEVSAEDLLADTELLNEVLAYHVVPGIFPAEGVAGLDGALLGTFLAGEALSVSLDGENVFVNESQVVAVDVTASNGIVHVIDAVLVPASDDMMEEDMAEEDMEMMEDMGTIADVVIASTEAETPEFTVLLAAVLAADPVVLESLTNNGPYTVFAPTDAAFAAALESLGLTAEELLADTETLTSILAYHVVPGYFEAADVLGALEMMEEGVSIATLYVPNTLSITTDGEGVFINEAALVATDVFASNGVIHVIDGVLLPTAEEEM